MAGVKYTKHTHVGFDVFLADSFSKFITALVKKTISNLLYFPNLISELLLIGNVKKYKYTCKINFLLDLIGIAK